MSDRAAVKWTALLLGLVCLMSAATGCAQERDLPADLARASPQWATHARELRVAGFTVEVVDRNQTLFRYSYGGRDCAVSQPPDASTIYYIASATKPFVAAAVARLAEQRKIDLDAPVRRYLPRFEVASDVAGASITVRDLLSHRQGLDSVPIEVAEAFTGTIDDDKFYRLLKQVRPRGNFRYSNLHYTLLGRIIEAVTGEPWQAYLRGAIFAPARMQRTVTTASAIREDPNAACALEETTQGWRAARIQKTDRTMHAAGGIGSSADDLGRWLQLQLGGGSIGGQRVLSAQSMMQMHSPQATVDSGFFTFGRAAYGLGWYIGTYRGHALLHHFGSFPGARSHLSFLPQEGIGVVVLMNEEEPVFNFVDAVASDVYDLALGLPQGGQWPRAVQATARLREKTRERWAGYRALVPADAAAERLVGDYVNDDWGTLRVVRDGDAVTASLGELPLPLYVNAATGEPATSMIDRKFEVSAQGDAIVLRHGNSLELRFTRTRAN